MRDPSGSGEAGRNVWHLKRYCDGDAENFEEFALTICFGESLAGGNSSSTVRVGGRLAPCGGRLSLSDSPKAGGDGVELEGELTKVALRLEHRDPQGELCVYRSERFVAEGDGQFRGVWMCAGKTGRFSAARRKLSEEPRKRKSACRRKADAEIKSKRFFNDLKDELLILDRLGWTEKRWKEESKLEKGRAILRELRRALEGILGQLGLNFQEFTPWLERVESGIAAARSAGDVESLRRLRAVDCSLAAPADDRRSDWHTLFEIQRHFRALPPFRATKYLEPSNVRHSLRCAEVMNRSMFERGLYIGGARQLSAARLPRRHHSDSGRSETAAVMAEKQQKIMEELREECIAGDLGVDEAYDVQIQLIIRAGCSEFIWEPRADVRLHYEDRVYYEQAHIWSEERRVRFYRSGQDADEMSRRLQEFERLLTGGREDQVYEEDFEFVEMTARAESGAAEGVPSFLEHSVTGTVEDAERLFRRAGEERAWTQRPKALNLENLFKTRLAGYRHQRTREIIWGPGPELYWERGDRPLRLLRMAQEPVRVRFCRREEPYGFHLQDLRGGSGGVEVVEVTEGSPADNRGVVVGRTVKRLRYNGQSEDVRHWSRARIEEALQRMPEQFSVEFGKGDTEERRHAPLGDAEMAILMDERFMHGFLHELWQWYEDTGDGAAPGPFDHEGWGHVFPGLDTATAQKTSGPPVAAPTPVVEASPSPTQPPTAQLTPPQVLPRTTWLPAPGIIGPRSMRSPAPPPPPGGGGPSSAVLTQVPPRTTSPMRVPLPCPGASLFLGQSVDEVGWDAAAAVAANPPSAAVGLAGAPGLYLPATGLASTAAATSIHQVGWQPFTKAPTISPTTQPSGGGLNVGTWHPRLHP